MKKPDPDLAYEWFKLVADGPCPNDCDEMLDDLEMEMVDGDELAGVRAPYERRRLDPRRR